MNDLPVKYLKTIAATCGLEFYYGDKAKQSFDSTHGTYPAIFMDLCKREINDFPNESNFGTIDIYFMVVNVVTIENYNSIDFDTMYTTIKAMTEKAMLYISRLRDYRIDGIPLFQTNENFDVEIIDGVPLGLFDNYVEGVVVHLRAKYYDTDTIC